MNNYFYAFLILFFFLFSCDKAEEVLVEDDSIPTVSVKSGLITTRTNLATFRPYDLDLMQIEFDNYLRSTSTVDSILLVPTHKAIIIHTNDIQTLHSIEKDTSLISFPFVFGENLPQQLSLVGSDDMDVIGEYAECCIESMEEPYLDITASISVLWPVDKPLPEDLTYDFCFNAFVPSSYHCSTENESSILSWVNNIQSSRISHPSMLKSYDNRLCSYIPMKNVPVYIINLPYVTQTETSSQGRFMIPDNLFDDETQLYCSLEDCDGTSFYVRDSVSNNVINKYIGTIGDATVIARGGNDSIEGDRLIARLFTMPWSFETDIYQAAWYYFHSNNDLLDNMPLYNMTGRAIDIYAIDAGHYLGCFYYPTSNYQKISIYKNGRTSSSFIFGTVLHELGHASHFAAMNSYSTFCSITKCIKESFASFSGWFNVKCFYSSVVSSDPDVNSICSQGRQTWHNAVSTNLNYTPLFIDLYDTYNQALINSLYVNDTISYVPVYVIVNLALTSLNFNQLYGGLYSDTINGVYYSNTQLSQFISQYGIFLNTKAHE